MGIFWSLLACLSWGVGDFFIQRSSRVFGGMMALLFITGIGSVALLPFVYAEIPVVLHDTHSLALLLITSAVIFIAALFNFEALRIGKLSVIEPIAALELLVTACVSAVLVKEHLSSEQIVFMCVLVCGIALISMERFPSRQDIRFEKGVGYALLSALTMGSATALFGVSGRDTSPLLVNWFTNTCMAGAVVAILAANARLKEIRVSWNFHRQLILRMSALDNLAWVAFTYSTISLPIAIATSVSESYIALAALLGMTWNHEILRWHQWIGFAATFIAAVLLARTTL